MRDDAAAQARDGPAVADLLVEFGHELREAGLPIGSGDVLTYCSAVATLDPSDLEDLFWAGRTTLVTRRDHLPVYDRVFREFFLGDDPRPVEVLRAPRDTILGRESVLQIPEAEPGDEHAAGDEAQLGLVASGVEVWRDKAFSACTPEELAALRRIMAQARLTPPKRRTRRTAAARSGQRLDPRRMARDTMRTFGEPGALVWRRRTHRIRPIVLILDVSGSMSDYSRNLLQFAYSARRASDRVEVFCFGTRLTRITKALDRRRADDAMASAAADVFDWDGGTRIGDSLDQFVRHWGRRGTSRGAIVVICSDGLDRGDPGVLAHAMERLHRLSHRVVWMNPHKGEDPDFVATSLAMVVAEPHIDLVVSGHDLRSLEAFAAMLPELR
jgi:uncharacterized protein